MAGARAKVNPLDHIRPAGRMYVGRDESVAYCMAAPEAPPISEHTRKFTTLAEAGTRVRHVGYRSDPTHEDKVHGSVNRAAGSNTSEALDQSKPTMTEFMEARAEAQFYKSVKAAPLGHVSVGGGFQTLPARTAEPGFAFGAPSGKLLPGAVTAKDVIFPVELEDPAEAAKGEALYATSHGTLPPGVQRKHGVRWEATGLDPARHAFGVRSTSGVHNAMAAIIDPTIDAVDGPTSRVVPKSVDDFRHASGDVVGQSRPRNLVDFADKAAHPTVFGKPSRGKRDAGDWSAADCLRGDYSAEEIAPDADLGRSVPAAKRAGAAAAASHLPHPDRRFGMPSIRTDVPARHGQSLASTTDFGTGTGAGQLLTPSPYAEHGVDESDFVAPRSAPELRDLFGRIGHRLTDPEFAAVYRRVREGTLMQACTHYNLTPAGSASVEEFRRALDEVLEAREEGREPAWLPSAGRSA